MRGSWLASFRWAARGVVETIARERNMRFHVVAALGVALWGSEVPLALAARLALVGCVLLVLAAEVLNTALESLVDLHTREHREEARRAKDAAAGVVLVIAAGAVCVAGVVLQASFGDLLEVGRWRGPLLLTDAAVLAAAAALVIPRRRPLGLDATLIALGVVLLGTIALRSVCLPFTAMGVAVFAAIATASRRSTAGVTEQRHDRDPAA